MTSDAGQRPMPPILVSADTVYDMIMSDINPELTTDQLPLLEARYQDETQEERAARLERYERDYATFDQALKGKSVQWSGDFRQYKSAALRERESESQSEESERMQSIAKKFL